MVGDIRLMVVREEDRDELIKKSQRERERETHTVVICIYIKMSCHKHEAVYDIVKLYDRSCHVMLFHVSSRV